MVYNTLFFNLANAWEICVLTSLEIMKVADFFSYKLSYKLHNIAFLTYCLIVYFLKELKL